MTFRTRRLLPALLLALGGCTAGDQPVPAESRSAVESTAPATPSVTPSVTPSSRPPSATVTPTPLSLVYQRGRSIHAWPLGGGRTRPRRLFDVRGEASADPAGRFLAVLEPGAVSVVALPGGRLLTRVARADAAVFTADGDVVVAIRPTDPVHEHDCHRPTHLVRVDLASGAQTPLAEMDDQFTPFAMAGGVLVGHVADQDCEVPTVVLLDLRTRAQRRVGSAGSGARSVTPDGTRIWVHLYPEDGTPRGREVVVDPSGREVARLGSHGTAAYGPGGRLAYTEVVYGRPGTAEYHFAQRTTVRVGRDLPAKGDPGVPIPDVATIVWSTDGTVFAVREATGRDDGASLRAVVCTPTLTCRRLGLTWYDEVTLLLVTGVG